MNLTRNRLTIQVDDSELVRLVLERLSDDPVKLPNYISATPAIGEYWPDQGGIYVGIARGRDGKSDYHLVLGPEFDSTADWDGAMKWAGAINVDGRTDFTLPTRKEQALLFANAAENFKEECYWSSEQHASNSTYAWHQGFLNGYQCYWFKDGRLRARAVRRLPI